MENIAAENLDLILFGLLLGAGLVLLVVSLIVRAKTGGKYEIRPVDLVLVLIPVVLWLFGTGKITKFNIAGVEVELAEAIREAAGKSITYKELQKPEAQVNEIMQNISMARKMGVEQIPELIKKKTEALEFQLGFSGYWGPAIEKYFETLGKKGFLKYVLIYNRDKTFFGIYDFNPLQAYVSDQGGEGYKRFSGYLINGDTISKDKLKELPGFVSLDDAVKPDTDQLTCLETMDRLDIDFLPVTDENRKYVGIVERSKITTRLIIDVTRAIEGAGGEK